MAFSMHGSGGGSGRRRRFGGSNGTLSEINVVPLVDVVLVLPRPDPKGRSFAFAILLHGSLIGGFIALNLINSQGVKFGDPNAGGASVGVEAVDKIPLPHSGPSNPVAHDTESEAPQAPPDK